MHWELIGFTAAALTTSAFIPQVAKMYKTKSANDISLVTLLQLSAGVSLWVLYGIYLKNRIIILANSVTLLTLLIALFLYYSYTSDKKQ